MMASDSSPSNDERPADIDASRESLDAHSLTEQPMEPMTLSLIGRLFGVPLLIIAAIVGGAVAVVFLFGAPVSGERRSVDDLLTALESSSGSKSVGMLLPREKELWQTALELTKRLGQKSAELAPGELAVVTKRLVGLLTADLEQVSRMQGGVRDDPDHRRLRFRRLEFVIHALGRTEHPDAIDSLLAVLKQGQEPFVRVAMQELGNLHELPESRRAVPLILNILNKSPTVETILTGCTVLSVLGRSDDPGVVGLLDSIRLREDGEASWSAALALARMGSDAGKSTLTDLLDRGFWETGDRYQTTDESGSVARYPMPKGRIDNLLIAAMEAAAVLDDSDLWEFVERLKSDPSPMVRGRAAEILAERV